MLPSKRQLPEINAQDTNLCFACGQDNPVGLKLKFNYSEGKAETKFTPTELYQGWAGVLHGGIICTLLDEAIGYATLSRGLYCITAKSEVRFKHYAPIGQTLIIRAYITRETKKLIESKASIVLEDNTEVAEGTSLMYVVNKEPASSLPLI